MTKQRSQFIYKFTGTIHRRQLWEAPPKSKYAGREYYRLVIKLKDQTQSISVFKNKLENPHIWTTLQQAQWGELSGQKYVFHCRNVRGYYHLVDWEKLPTKGQALSETKGGKS